jgi:hypothetical protein
MNNPITRLFGIHTTETLQQYWEAVCTPLQIVLPWKQPLVQLSVDTSKPR